MTFRVTILGSSSALPTVRKYPSAHALNVHEQFFLIDCGEGTQIQLRRYGFSPQRLNAIFLTHLHGDHTFGLFGLLSTMGLQGRKTPLRLYGPHPLEAMLHSHLQYFDTTLPYELQITEVDTCTHTLIYENTTLEVWTIPLRHRVPTCGYLFREKQPPLNIHKEEISRYGLTLSQIQAAKRGLDLTLEDGTHLPNTTLTYRPYTARSYAYLSDTLYSAKAAHLVEGVDLLYHEATFMDSERALARQTGHSTTLQAAKAALTAQAGHLLIGHFSTRYKDEKPVVSEARTLFTATDAAREGDVWEIQPSRPSGDTSTSDIRTDIRRIASTAAHIK